MAQKPKLYALLAENRYLPPTGGDKINEARFLKALSSYFDVYYNNIPYDANIGTFGDPDQPIIPPTIKYDLYYVRANQEIFLSCPSPKIAMAFPFDPVVFEAADALVVTTQTWKELLLSYNVSSTSRDMVGEWYGNSEKLPLPNHICNISQARDEIFMTPNPMQVRKCKYSLTNGFICGYFGRLSRESLPDIALTGADIARKCFPQVTTILAGFQREALDTQFSLLLDSIPYREMPNHLYATDAVFANEEKASMFLGSGKVIDAICTKTPILAQYGPVRVEQLGEDYPLYYSTQEEVAQKITQLIINPSFTKNVKEYLGNRAALFSRDKIGKNFYDFFLTLV